MCAFGLKIAVEERFFLAELLISGSKQFEHKNYCLEVICYFGQYYEL